MFVCSFVRLIYKMIEMKLLSLQHILLSYIFLDLTPTIHVIHLPSMLKAVFVIERTPKKIFYVLILLADDSVIIKKKISRNLCCNL